MQIPLVMTIIGQDRPGLVELVAAVVAEHGGNWLESRMCRLGGEFAGILRIQLPAENEARLQAALHGLQARGLSIVIRPDRTPATELVPSLVNIDLVGQDRPGIVRQISSTLARYGVNVEELNSECCSAPMSGETLFKAHIRVHIPAGAPVEELRRELEKIAADLLVDITIGGPQL